MNNAFAGLEGVFAVADDIIVIGCGETMIEAENNHEANLSALRQRCTTQNILLDEAKAVVKTKEIRFMGHLISNKDIKADPSKVKAIQDKLPPTDVSGVKRLCGMVQYLARFLPNLADDLEPLRMLTRKGQPWKWTDDCEKAVQTIKDKISAAPVLAYYDPEQCLVLQVDSSKDGTGAVLMQNNQPLEYASRALTKSERNWVQIEKEALSVVFGLERFDQYTYGRDVIVNNDHRPFEMNLKKPLSQAPKRLQTLIMRLNRYNIQFKYVPGTTLVIADTLSRAYPELNRPDNLPSRIMHISSSLDEIPDENLKIIKEAMQTDLEAKQLLNVIQNGWPDNRNNLHDNVKPYFSMRDSLSFDNGFVFKGERIFIPKLCRNIIKSRLHIAHLGYDSVMRRARDTVFWLGMSKDIKLLTDNCNICQALKPCNPNEPLR